MSFRDSRPRCVRALLGGDWELAVLLRRCFSLREWEEEILPFGKRAECPFLSWMMSCKKGFSLLGLAVLFSWPPHPLTEGILPGAPEQPWAASWSVLLPHGYSVNSSGFLPSCGRVKSFPSPPLQPLLLH